METTHKKYLAALAEQVETQLLRYVQVTPETERQAQVVEAMRYSLAAGGKRIRPVLVLEFCRLCGGTSETAQKGAMAAACALEMIHTFSLIHDDLPEMDNDDFRRGKPSCHKAFGVATALLAGDALLNEAFQILADDLFLSAEQKVQMLHVLTKATGASEMIGGQIMDMAFETRNDVTLEEQTAMCAAKTGALIRAACKLGCIAAESTKTQRTLADEYGAKLGLAFQIVDDILDVTGSEEVLGKPVGSDAQEGKTTFVTLLGLEEARKRAEILTQEALEILEQFSEHDFLTDLTRELLIREK